MNAFALFRRIERITFKGYQAFTEVLGILNFFLGFESIGSLLTKLAFTSSLIEAQNSCFQFH
jgi:hypothetical protein